MEFLELERISPIDIVEEYNQYTQPASIADSYVVPDMVDGFLWALFFNGMTLFIIIALFMIIRKSCESVYSARLKSKLRYDEYDGQYFYNTERLVPASGYYNEQKPPDQTLSQCWTWIKFLFNHSEVQVFHDLGLDEVVMTKVHVLAMEIFSVILILNVPLYLYYAIDSDTRFEWNHSMADVEPGSWILWIYFCFVWIKSCVCLFFLWRHTKSFVRLRQEHLATSIDERLEDCEELHPRDREILSVHKRTIFVDHIPRGQRTEERIRAMFDAGIWKGRVQAVYVKRRVEDENQHASNVRRVETATKSATSTHTKTMHFESVSWHDLNLEYNSWRSLPKLEKRKSDDERTLTNLFYFRRRVSTFKREAREYHIKQQQQNQVSTPKADAFVVFDSPHTANAAAQMKFSIENGMRTKLAPSPRNVYDKNIGYHGWAGFDARFFFTVIFYILLILFWAVPVSLVASLTSLDSIEEHWDWVASLRQHEWLFDIVQTYLPTLGLYLFMTLLPYILHYASRFEGLKTKSDIDRSLMTRYFVFLIMNILLVASLSGGIFAVVYHVSSDLGDIPELLGKSLPNMYLFFVSYVMLQAMTILPLDLLRLPSLFCNCWRTQMAPTSLDDITILDPTGDGHSEITNAALHQGHGSGEKVARDLLVFSISLVYSTFTPLMLPFSLFYFAFGLILHRQQAYYCYVRAFESGGDMWRSVVDCVVVCVVVYVLALQGMLLLLDGALQSFLLTPLLVLILLGYYHIRTSYGSLMKYLAMSSNFKGSSSNFKGSDKISNKNTAGSINVSTPRRREEEKEEVEEIDPETPLLGAKRYPSVFLNDPTIAFRAYASEFGGTMGSIGSSGNKTSSSSSGGGFENNKDV